MTLSSVKNVSNVYVPYTPWEAVAPNWAENCSPSLSLAQGKVEMNVDRFYRKPANAVAGNPASTANPFLLQMVWQDFLFIMT